MSEISRINIKGITRTPSDRVSEDGGCAELINAISEGGEIVPLASVLGETFHDVPLTKDDIVYKHKGLSYVNYIYTYSDLGDLFIYQYIGHERPNELLSLEQTTVQSIMSVGNTLIVNTNKDMHYFLYDNIQYKYLGTELPHIDLEISASKINDSIQQNASSANFASLSYTGNQLQYSEYYNEASHTTGRTNIMNYKGVLASIKEGVSGILKSKDVYVHPVMVRTAIRLYDGSYTYQSVPMLLQAKKRRVFNAYYRGEYDDYTKKYTATIKVKAYDYNLELQPKITENWDAIIEKWKDIIMGIDVFVSDPIIYDDVSVSNIISATEDGSAVEDGIDKKFGVLEFSEAWEENNLSPDEWFHTELMRVSNFYRAASYTLEELKSYSLGINAGQYKSLDWLYSQQRLPDGYLNNHKLSASGGIVFNGRVLLSNPQYHAYKGYPYWQGITYTTNTTPTTIRPNYLQVTYIIKNIDGTTTKVTSDYVVEKSNSSGNVPCFTGYISYPDANCVKAIFTYTQNGQEIKKSVEMKQHPALNLAYAFWGLEKNLDSLLDETDNYTNSKDRLIEVGNEIIQTEYGNPFIVNASGIINLHHKINAYAAATKALSEGQFGQFPLYVFTEGGIYAMPVNTDGTLLSPTMVSAEVCTSKNVLSLEQSVVFATEKGLMCISGSEVTELSSALYGKHYTIESTAMNLVKMVGYQQFEDTLKDKESFYDYLKNSKLTYDYRGKRIIVINPEKSYQYIYKLDSNTWHKLKYEKLQKITTTVNSYPQTEVIAIDTNGQSSLVDISIDLNKTDNSKTEKMVIITRAIDFENPDVLKTINKVMIRSTAPRNAIQFILLGSDDAINYNVLTSLRGKSWKFFRIIILAHITELEKISYIEIEYDPKLRNKLR